MSKEDVQSLIHSASVDAKSKHVLVIHGGAGTMNKRGATPEQRVAYHTALQEALIAGYNVLSEGGEALDAVVAAVSSMEGMFLSERSILSGRCSSLKDNPLFNAGKGAVFNAAGKV